MDGLLIIDGDGGMDSRACYNRSESPALGDRTRSLVLVNYFHTIPLRLTACMEHSLGLLDVLGTCYTAAGNRWANFLAVDYYKVLCHGCYISPVRTRTLKCVMQQMFGRSIAEE